MSSSFLGLLVLVQMRTHIQTPMNASVGSFRHFLIGLLLFLPIDGHSTDAAESRQPSPPLPSGVQSLTVPGLHNVFALGTNVFSGSSPESENAFVALEKLRI